MCGGELTKKWTLSAFLKNQRGNNQQRQQRERKVLSSARTGGTSIALVLDGFSGPKSSTAARTLRKLTQPVSGPIDVEVPSPRRICICASLPELATGWGDGLGEELD